MSNFIEEYNQIPELFILKHKHDTTLPEQGYDYQDKLLINTLSPIMFNNDKNEVLLTQLNKMMLSLIESILPTRNIFYYTHSKYFNRHGR